MEGRLAQASHAAYDINLAVFQKTYAPVRVAFFILRPSLYTSFLLTSTLVCPALSLGYSESHMARQCYKSSPEVPSTPRSAPLRRCPALRATLPD